MIEFDLGLPGSGKTYKAMYSLYSNFGLNDKFKDSKFKHNDIKFAYTNINEIKLEHFKKDTVKKLDWDEFKTALQHLHLLYKSKKEDSVLIEKAKELNIFECLIIIDECHNYLDVQDKVLVWWLSYHRHLHHQVYLITQNLALVNSKYKSFSEFFYMAKPSSLKIFKNKMVYTQYTTSRMSMASKSGVIKIPFIKEIFDSYHSGANQQSENVLKKFVVIAILFFLLLIFILIGIQSYWTTKAESINETSIKEETPVKEKVITEVPKLLFNNKDSLYDTTDLQLFKFVCYGVFCNYRLEDKSNFKVPANILNSYLEKIEEDKKYFHLQDSILFVYILVEKDRFSFIPNLKQGEKDENKIFDNSFNIIGN